jgi:hypothetical protein
MTRIKTGWARSPYSVRIHVSFERDSAGVIPSPIDTMETFFDSRIDLLQRHLAKQTVKLKTRAEEVIKTRKVRTPGGEELDREVQKIKLKVRTLRLVSNALTHALPRCLLVLLTSRPHGTRLRPFGQERRYRSSLVFIPCSSPLFSLPWLPSASPNEFLRLI